MERTITVSLLAGQTVQVQLFTQLLAVGANVGVFDPDGRLIDSDRSLQAVVSTVRNSVSGEPFQFTATMPGDYRFAVANNSDSEFNNTGTSSASQPCHISCKSPMSRILLGGVRAGGNVLTYENGLPGISVHEGDLGGVTSDAAAILNAGPGAPMVPAKRLASVHCRIRSITATCDLCQRPRSGCAF